MFRVKICGVRRVDDALVASEAGADALGVNFYAQSKRCATREEAQAIAAAIPAEVLLVGVFVNATADQIETLAEEIPLGAVQLHGDEPPEFLSQLPSELSIIRALRMGADGLAPIANYVDDCGKLGRLPEAVLIDAASSKGYGGTGEQIDWGRVNRERGLLGDLPLIVAGGLNASNITQAIAKSLPDGVDTASGVESSPGVKDHEQLRRFIKSALMAF